MAGWFDMGQVTMEMGTTGVATVTLSNPDRMNAMTFGMWQALEKTMQALNADARVRVVILRGSGDAAFVSGADISEFNALRATPEGVARYDAAVEAAEAAVGACSKPVIAAISGVCYGGGLGIAFSCDLRFSSQHARFCLPAGKLGLGYALEDVQRMHNVLGAARTAELLLTARVYRGQETVTAGMAHACVDDVFAHASEQAELIASYAPLTLRSIKMALHHLRGDQQSPSAAAVAASVAACFASQDYAEGRQAFAQKRTPVFKGQ